MALNLGRKIASGALLGGLNLGLGALVMLLATPLIVRELGVQGYGIYGLMLAAFGILSLLSFGGQEATLYFCAKDGSAAHARALGLWHLAGALGGMALFWIGGKALGLGRLLGLNEAEGKSFEDALLSGSAFWAAQFFCNWLWNLCRARLHFTLLGSHQALLTVIAPISGLVAAHLYGGVAAFLWGQAAAWALGSLILLPWMRGLFGFSLSAPWAEIWAFSRWALLINLSFVALQSADRFFVASFGAAALGAYSLASSLYQRGISAFGLLPTLLIPAISRMEKGDSGRAARAYGLTLRLGAVLTLAGFLPLMGLGDAFLLAWLPNNPEMAALAYGPLFLLSAAGCLGALSSVLHAVLLGMGRARQVALSGLCGAGIGYAAAWLAMPSLGFEAAALCGLAGYASIYSLRLFISEKRVFKRALFPIALEHSALLCGAALAVLALRQFAPYLMGRSLPLQLAALCASAALIAALAMAADAILARRLGREGVQGALFRILGRA